MDIKHRFKDAAILLIAFVISIAIRSPNFDRPLSKHHEFVNACTLNGIISWQEGGGASKFDFVPLMTYQGTANRLLIHGMHTDDKGNEYYLSVGPGWYIVSYLIFQLFHATPTPMGLVYINLFFGILTLAALYFFLQFITSIYTLLPRQFSLYGCLVFLFMPGPLWYFGNLYIQSALVLPFAIILTLLFLKYSLDQQKINIGFTITFFITGIAAIYMDWFGFFLLAAFVIYSCIQYIKSKQSSWLKMAIISCITATVGVAIIFLQFAHLLGWQNIMDYWRNRASGRSFNYDEGTVMVNIIRFSSNFFSCTGIASIGAFAAIYLFVKNKKISFPWLPFLVWGMASIGYNIVFYNWSFVHEFSMMPISVLIAMLAVFYLVTIIPPKKLVVVLLVIFSCDVFQYYYINRPGKISRAGVAYDTDKLLGEQIKQKVPMDYRIFCNAKCSPMVEYYAHRSFVLEAGRDITIKKAQQICDSFNVRKAVWLNIDSDRIKELHILR